MTVEITLGFFVPPDRPGAFPSNEGGVRIAVDSEVLTDHVRVRPEAAEAPIYDAHGELHEYSITEFTGESLELNLQSFHEALVRFEKGEYDRFEEVPARITSGGESSVIVLSFVDGTRARIAFQPSRASVDTKHYRDESMLGYIVDPNDLCRELIGCYREWMTFVDNAFPDHPGFPEEAIPEFHERYEGKIAELEELID